MYWYLCIGNMPYDLMMIHIRCRTLSCQASQVASALDTPLFSLQLPRNNCFLHTTGKFFHLCLINSIIATCYTCKYCVTICCLLLHCLTGFLCQHYPALASFSFCLYCCFSSRASQAYSWAHSRDKHTPATHATTVEGTAPQKETNPREGHSVHSGIINPQQGTRELCLQ